MKTLPVAAMDRIIRSATPARVSDEAAKALRECLEQEAQKIIQKANTISKHANRNTIMQQDIALSRKN